MGHGFKWLNHCCVGPTKVVRKTLHSIAILVQEEAIFKATKMILRVKGSYVLSNPKGLEMTRQLFCENTLRERDVGGTPQCRAMAIKIITEPPYYNTV